MLNRSLSPTALSYSNLSLSNHQFNNNGSQTNVATGIIPSATEEVLKLRKDIRMKEADFAKEKAILQQKVEQLEQQLRDSKEREDQQRKLHDSMINCLNANANSNGDQNQAQQAITQLQTAEKQLQSEIHDLQMQKRRLYDELEFKDKEVKRQLADKDICIKDSQIQMERLLLEKRQYMFQWEQEKKELQQKVQSLSSDKDQFTLRLESMTQNKSNEQEGAIDKMKHEHQKEVDRMKAEFEQNLKEMKYYHDQDKYNWQNKVERSTQELSSLIRLVKQRGEAQDQEVNQSLHMVKKKEELEQEITHLQMEVDQIKKQYDVTVSKLNQEKLAAENKALKLQKQLEKIKNAPKPVQIDLSSVVKKADDKEQKSSEAELKALTNLKEEVQLLQRENEKLNEQVRKLRKELLDNQDYIDRIENNERKLRSQLKEKQADEQIQDKLREVSRQLNDEKRRNIDLEERMQDFKEQLEQVSMRNQTLLLEKDQKITRMSKELRDTERKLQDIQSVFNSTQRKSSRNQSPFHGHANTGTIPAEFTTHQRNISYSPIGGASQMNTTQQNFLFPIQQHNGRNSPRVVGQSTAITTGMMQEGQMIMKQISQLEFTLLKTCQRMADQAIRMECATCFQVFETGDFYDHLIQDHPQPTHKTTASSGTVTQSQSSVNTAYHSGRQQQTLTSKRYAEDINVHNSTLQNLNILQTSPKVKESSRNQNQHQAHTATTTQGGQKWIQSSRSFTCLLNEIEEEEKTTCNQPLQSHQLSSVQSVQKRPKHTQSKSPVSMGAGNISQNTSTMQKTSRNQQVNFQTMGNTLASVVQHQKQQKKGKSSKNLSSTNPQNLTVMTACRTEIQNLKRQNKKLESKVTEQETKLIDVSRDCSAIKKQVKHETKKDKGQQSQLTNEIKGLLEKLVSFQGPSEKISKRGSDYGSGAFTSRQCSNIPMSTESMVELKSSTSSIFDKAHKKKHKENKSPINCIANTYVSGENKGKQPIDQHLQHNSNKENMHGFHRKASHQHNSTGVPKLNFTQQQLIPSENHLSSTSSAEQQVALSMLSTERRYHQVKRSEDLCSNSPRRYQNYFEVLQSVTESLDNETEQSQSQQPQHSMLKQQNRYSPQKKESKILSTKTLSRGPTTEVVHQPERATSRNQVGAYNSKLPQQYTICSSQNNLVIYDSSNTDMFKSKQLKYYPAVGSTTHVNQINSQGAKRLDFDHQTLSIEDSECENYQQCASIDGYEENESRRATQRGAERGIFSSSVDEDPFITGRFCDNNGTAKQFLFKYSQNNSKNSTIRELHGNDLN